MLYSIYSEAFFRFESILWKYLACWHGPFWDFGYFYLGGELDLVREHLVPYEDVSRGIKHLSSGASRKYVLKHIYKSMNYY